MKYTLLLLVLMVFSLSVQAQQNWINFSGGYAFANTQETEANLNGYRLNFSYERNAYEGQWVHGFVVGYISTEASYDPGIGQADTDYELNTMPMYYMPKYLIGRGSFQGFVKGALGMHYSQFTKTELITIEDNGVGFYGGLGVGAMFTFNRFFVAGEYEWAFASNSYYKNGFINSAMVSLGIKF